MFAVLADQSPQEFMAMIYGGALVAIVLILTTWNYYVRALADETALKRERQEAELALKRELIQKGLSTDELARRLELLRLDEPRDTDAEANLVKNLALLPDLPGETIESTLNLIHGIGPARQQAILGVVEELIGQDAASPAVIAAVRSMCNAPPPASSDAIRTANRTP